MYQDKEEGFDAEMPEVLWRLNKAFQYQGFSVQQAFSLVQIYFSSVMNGVADMAVQQAQQQQEDNNEWGLDVRQIDEDEEEEDDDD